MSDYKYTFLEVSWHYIYFFEIKGLITEYLLPVISLLLPCIVAYLEISILSNHCKIFEIRHSQSECSLLSGFFIWWNTQVHDGYKAFKVWLKLLVPIKDQLIVFSLLASLNSYTSKLPARPCYLSFLTVFQSPHLKIAYAYNGVTFNSYCEKNCKRYLKNQRVSKIFKNDLPVSKL